MAVVASAIRAAAAAAVIAAALLGCTRAPNLPSQAAALSFAAQPPLALDVAAISLIDQSGPPSPGDIGGTAPLSPLAAVQQWANERLRAVGAAGTAEVIVLDDMLLGERLARTDGMQGSFVTDQAERYTTRIEVEVRISGRPGIVAAGASGFAERGRTLPEGTTPAQRDATIQTLVAEAMQALDAELTRQMQANMAALLR
jgi:hypothetical protein